MWRDKAPDSPSPRGSPEPCCWSTLSPLTAQMSESVLRLCIPEFHLRQTGKLSCHSFLTSRARGFPATGCITDRDICFHTRPFPHPVLITLDSPSLPACPGTLIHNHTLSSQVSSPFQDTATPKVMSNALKSWCPIKQVLSSWNKMFGGWGKEDTASDKAD